MAVFRDQPAAVRIFLAGGADANVGGAEGDSPLRWCVHKRNHEMAYTLLRCGAGKTIDEPGGPTGMTALGRAASLLDLPMMELLLRFGAGPDAVDADRLPPHRRLPDAPEHREVRDAALALLDKYRRR